MSDELREQVSQAIGELIDMDDANHLGAGHDYGVVADAVIPVVLAYARSQVENLGGEFSYNEVLAALGD